MRELWRASGYLVVFVPPLLLLVGIASDHPWTAFLAMFAGMPFIRGAFGDVDEGAPIEWRERTTTWLDRLPLAYAGCLVLSVVLSLWKIRGGALHRPSDWIGAGFSLWTCYALAFGACHEMVHDRRPLRRRIGRAFAGIVGYPVIAHEHLPHHATSGEVEAAEWPRVDESLWSFVARRMLHVIGSAIEYNTTLGLRRGSILRGGLFEALFFTLVSWISFSILCGIPGALLYAAVVVGVWFAMQAFTYLQHWGLGVDSVPNAREGQFAWEDTCRLQAWLTFHIPFHQAHHYAPSRPYYWLMPVKGSARLPGGYVLMFYAAMIPALWQRLMRPALARWRSDPAAQRAPGRRLICVQHGIKKVTSDDAVDGS
jgi:alkane 1-monooxygenase